MVLNVGLEGSHVLITGGSRGLGLSMVENFAREGANVSYCARNVSENDFAAFETANPTVKGRIHGTSVDITSRDKLYAWVEEASTRTGRLDVIIANASNMDLESTPEKWNNSFNLDLMGFVNLVEAALPWLEKAPSPSIIVQSSFMGREFFRSPPAPYGACKAAQLQHVQELSHSLGPKGIRVNAISPGPILAPGGPWELYMKLAPEWVEEQRLKVPLKRLGDPQEISNVAMFLASPLSSYVSGANVLADGGIHVGTQF